MRQLTDLDRQRLLAKLFTRPLVSEIGRSGTVDLVFRKLRLLGVNLDTKGVPPGEMFDACLEELAKNYRCEYVYKSAIANRIVFGRHSPRTAGMQLELPVGNSIVDVAVFNGTSTAYEIKTELDSGKRLAAQSPDYLKVFDRVYVVTHPSLAAGYLATVDQRVGVLALNARGRFTEMREAISDVSRVEPKVIFRMLRRNEYMSTVAHRFGRQPKLPNGAVFAHYESLFLQLTPEQAHEAFVEAIRKRTTDNATVSYLLSLPKSLRALGYATPLSGVRRDRLLKAFA